ncbi:hypothetical protein ACLK1S_16820 [Escherichia coli]
MITAFVGGLYALMEHNIERLLAHHNPENIGIILLGLGAGVTGIASGELRAIALSVVVGAGTICLTIACSKAVLFLGRGSVWFVPVIAISKKLGGIGKSCRLSPLPC